MRLEGRKVLVVGLGRSGVAAADLCLRRGAAVRGNDAAPLADLSPEARALAPRGARLETGGHDRADWSWPDLVVVSPGVPPLREVDAAEARGVEVIGELELGWRFARAPAAAIGGTNGKSTTTALVAAMLEASGMRVFAGANLGVPLCSAVDAEWDALVLEVSSFQTERVATFRPRVAALLNVTDDHLDRYADFGAYARAKGNLFVRQGTGDVAVVPAGDAICARQAARGGGRVVTFGPDGDVDLATDALVDRSRSVRYPIAALRLPGLHNARNACAAIACAAEMGASQDAVARALRDFRGLRHRTALVAEIGGVRFYDDSKGTNVGAVVAALDGMTEPRVVLVAGGRDKLGSYAPLAEALARKGRAAVLIGEAADRIADAVRAVVEVRRAGSMDEAVESAARLARPGDAVLLSPACSSYDMFRDYEDRGEAFVRAVERLAAAVAPGRGP